MTPLVWLETLVTLTEHQEIVKEHRLAVRAALNHLPEAQLFLKVYRDPEIVADSSSGSSGESV
jgi:hypothetical protein